jgi:NAD(P)H-flavin reductase/ferredoxin
MSFDVAVADSTYRFACEPGESLLDAAERGGFEMPYSCRKGICGNCRGKIETGEVRRMGSDSGLTQDEREHGYVLYCRSTPVGDLTIRPVEIKPAQPNARKVIKAKVYRIERAADDVTLLRLRFPAGMRAKFRAGQYLQIILADGQRREFSMANPPGISDEAHLHIRHVENGFFTAGVLPGLQPGQVLEVEVPFGDFYLREDGAKPLVFIATGTGFAPIASIVEDLWRRQIERPFSLYWGGRTWKHLYAIETVRKWMAAHPQVTFVPVLSHTPSQELDGARAGLVHEAVLADFPSLAGVQVYACGSPAMTRAARQTFTSQAGLAEEDFFSDAFVSGPVEAQDEQAG